MASWGPESSNNHRRRLPTGATTSKKHKKLLWAHVTAQDVNSALSGLLENTVVVLPESCVQAGGIQPNINDKNKPKRLWLGRLRYLRYLLTASMLEEADNPEEVRRAMLQSAVSTVEHCRGGNCTGEEVAVAVKFARMSDTELKDIARAAVTIQSAWRGARARKGTRVLDVLDDYFSECVIKGCVLFLCGSTGVAGDSLRYVRMLAGMGYIVLAPDHMASNSDFFSRNDASVLIRYEDVTDYWERNLLYEDDGAKIAALNSAMIYITSSRCRKQHPLPFPGCLLRKGKEGTAPLALWCVSSLAEFLPLASDSAGQHGRPAAAAPCKDHDEPGNSRPILLTQGELVYSSTSANVLNDPEHFDHVYNNVITIRQSGVSLILRRLPPFMKRHGVFVFGMSEGAVVLSSYHDEMYSEIIRGRILCSYSCEQNYWNYNRPEDAGISGSASVPTLNIMGYVDEYFGYQDSVAATVARCGDYPAISGNAFDAMVAAGLEWGLVAHLEGGKHALTWTHDDIIRELLSDFLERPQYTTRQIPYLWSHVRGLQDEITRVRRSADGKVHFLMQTTYIRIRPPAPGAAVSQNEHIEGKLLLNKLNRRLYQLETDQPLSPLSDGGSYGRTFGEALRASASSSAPTNSLQGFMSTANSGDFPSFAAASSPVSSTVEDTVFRSLSTNLKDITTDKLTAANIARVICHVDAKPPPGEEAFRASDPGHVPRLVLPHSKSATELLDDLVHPSGSKSPRSLSWDEEGLPPAASPSPSAPLPNLSGLELGGSLSTRTSFSMPRSPINVPPAPQLPTLIVNKSLATASKGRSSAERRAVFKEMHIAERDRMENSEHEPMMAASRVSHWILQDLSHRAQDLPRPASPNLSAAKDSSLPPRYPTGNVHPRAPAAGGGTSSNAGDQFDAPTLHPLSGFHGEDAGTPNSRRESQGHHSGQLMQELARVMASQAKASAAAHHTLDSMAKACATIAVAGAVSSGIAVLALVALLRMSIQRK